MKDSRPANTVKIAISVSANTSPPIDISAGRLMWAMIAAIEKNRPILCANLFGGPGTSLGFAILCAKKRVAKIPIGLSVGPVATLAANPYASRISTHSSPVNR